MRELLAGWRDRTWPHRLLAGRRPEPARVVAVAGVSVRAGTTTVAALLATAYAEAGRGRVVVLDRRSALGTAPGADDWSVLAPHLEKTGPRLWAVPSATAEPELLAAQATLAALSPHFAVAVLDCGHQAGPQARFLLGLAHVRLLVAIASVDGVLGAAAAADRLQLAGRPDAAARTLVGLIGAPDRDAAALLTARGAAVHWLPYDPVLAEGGSLALADLSDELRRAVLGTSAELLRRAGR